MGINSSSINCCLSNCKSSFLEVNLGQVTENSFNRGSSYESPIPEEVFQDIVVKNSWVLKRDEYSTDAERVGDIYQDSQNLTQIHSSFNYIRPSDAT